MVAYPKRHPYYPKGDGVSMEVKTVLTNSLGFGGHNACLLVRKFEE